MTSGESTAGQQLVLSPGLERGLLLHPVGTRITILVCIKFTLGAAIQVLTVYQVPDLLNNQASAWLSDSRVLRYQILLFENPQIFSSIQLSHSVVYNCLQPHGLQHARPPCPSSTPGVYPNSCPIESVMPFNHLILCHLLLLLPSIFPSTKVFPNDSALLIRCPKYWSFSFSISPSNEHSGLISFRMDWLDLLAVLGTLKSLLQHHSSKASIHLHSAFFIVQFSHPYMTTGETITLTRWTFVGKVMSLLFNMLLVINFP